MKVPIRQTGPAWLERVPPERNVSRAGSALVVASTCFGILVTRQQPWLETAEGALACAAIAVVFLSPIRVGPALSLGSVAVLLGLEALGGHLTHGLPLIVIGLGMAFLVALFSASYLRLGIRRRDSELEIAGEAIAELTRQDRITELLSGGQESTWLEAELLRSRRHHHHLSLVLIAPDRFEEFEEQGEELALQVLEATAEVIGSELRATDVALRRDRGVFSVILPETPSEGARAAAERIRLFLPVRLRPALTGPVTVSIGIASFPRDATTNDDLIRVAERARLRAAELGGNRTLCASIESDAPPGWTLARDGLGGDGPRERVGLSE